MYVFFSVCTKPFTPCTGPIRFHSPLHRHNHLKFTLLCVLAFPLLLGSPVFAGTFDTGPKELPKPKLKAEPPIFQEWSFDHNPENNRPIGFLDKTVGGNSLAQWKVIADPIAPSRPHILTQTAACPEATCFHLLYANMAPLEYFDLSVRLHSLSGTEGGAGLLYGTKDADRFYAITIRPDGKHLDVVFVENGKTTVLGSEPVETTPVPWRFLRIRRTHLISHRTIEVFYDRFKIFSLTENSVREGYVGLVTYGNAPFAFDNLRVIESLTGRPLSRPPAY